MAWVALFSAAPEAETADASLLFILPRIGLLSVLMGICSEDGTGGLQGLRALGGKNWPLQRFSCDLYRYMLGFLSAAEAQVLSVAWAAGL